MRPIERNFFIETIVEMQQENNSLVCVGLDTDPEKIPEHIREELNPMFVFNKAIVDATADLVCAFKPQVAFYSAVERGDINEDGEEQLRMTVEYIHDNYDIPVILDAKRGDIGNTAGKYGIEVFQKYAVDAVTVNPYLGRDACQPFLDWSDQGIIILCRTSNPGAEDFQDLSVIYQGETIPLYEVVARKVAYEWNKDANCGLVMGGIRPDDKSALRAMKQVRRIVGDIIPFIVPGIGAQGGDVKITVEAGVDSEGRGLIINSSRGIIYASKGKDFTDAARKATIKLRDEINKYR